MSMVQATIEAAFNTIKRADFMPDGVKSYAGMNMAVPIGFGQTISQPYTVERMLEWLDCEPDDIVLDVGSGSGWTTALLAITVGSMGHVYAVEKIPELVDFGRQNCDRYNLKNVEFHESGNTLGLPEFGPYDRILVSAAANELPFKLVEQLKVGGKMIVPVHGDILEVTLLAGGGLDIVTHPGFAFVPLVTNTNQ